MKKFFCPKILRPQAPKNREAPAAAGAVRSVGLLLMRLLDGIHVAAAWYVQPTKPKLLKTSSWQLIGGEAQSSGVWTASLCIRIR